MAAPPLRFALSRSSHEGHHDDHNAFLRILEESVVTGGVSGRGNDLPPEEEEFDDGDNQKVKDIEDKIQGTTEFWGDLKVKINRLIRSREEATQHQETKAAAAKEKQTLQQKISGLKQSSKSEEQTTSQTNASPKSQTKRTGMNILLLYANDWTHHHTLSSFHKTQPINSILQTPTLDALSQELTTALPLRYVRYLARPCLQDNICQGTRLPTHVVGVGWRSQRRS
jgi:hypothetical protein